MALMLGALNEALLAAGAGSDKARKAAEEVAEYNGRSEMAEIMSDLRVVKWMLGVILAGIAVLILREFF